MNAPLQRTIRRLWISSLVWGWGTVVYAQTLPAIPAAVVGPTMPGYEPVIIALIGAIASVLLSIIATVAGIFKSNIDRRATTDLIKMQHDSDRQDRQDKADELRRLQEAQNLALRTDNESVRSRLEANALAIQQQLEKTNASTLDRAEATRALVLAAAKDATTALDAKLLEARMNLAEQTDTLRRAIDEAKVFTSARADMAYNEANSVNVKIEKLNAKSVEMAQALAHLTSALAGADASRANLAGLNQSVDNVGAAAEKDAEARRQRVASSAAPALSGDGKREDVDGKLDQIAANTAAIEQNTGALTADPPPPKQGR